MSIRLFAQRKMFHLVGSFLGLVLLPLWLWAVRAPDAANAPLPDYDIRRGYGAGFSPNHPLLAAEALRLRQQRAAKRAAAQATGEPGTPWIRRSKVEDIFGADVSAEWNPNGTPSFLYREDHPLLEAQFGDDPVGTARYFLRLHQSLFRLSDEAVEGLKVVNQVESPSGARHITFRQTVDGVPVFQGDFKVNLTAENAVLSAGGTLLPELNVPPRANFTAVDAARAAAGYVGSLTKPGKAAAAFEPKVLRTEAGPESKTFLSRGPFRRDLLATRVVFPLTPSQGRPAWQVYVMKSPMESYRVVVDAEDGALLSRQSLVKFVAVANQGLVFLTHPDDGAQVLRSFVGDATASPNTFVDTAQSGLFGNNVVMGAGATDSLLDFQFTFTDDYETNGLLGDFDLDGVTLRFTPNGSGGYDLTLPAFFDPPTGTVMSFLDDDGLPATDDGSNCSTGPPTGFTFFGASVTSLCVSINGNMVMGTTPDSFFIGDQIDLPLLPPRIMGLWDDFIIGSGSITFEDTVTGRRCFRWNGVSEFGTSNSNSFAICLWGTAAGGTPPAGTIDFTYNSVATLDGMVGIHPATPSGNLVPAGTAGYDELDAPNSTVGPVGLVQVFPNHADYAAAATNVFWQLNDTGHDRLYAAGFRETDGNMQTDNFGRGGLGNDPIIAASDWVDFFAGGGPLFNNAFFGTSAEGSCCSFTAFGLFTTGVGFRDVDSSFDSDVVVHEHGHGVSTRLVGSLDLTQGGAMGEGWSDWFAVSYADDPVMGEYVTGNTTTGLRGVAYDASSTRQFGDLGNIFGPFNAVDTGFEIVVLPTSIFAPEVHDDGEIWASALADVRQSLLTAGVSNADVERLIIEGLAATPSEPTMLSARNAIMSVRSMVAGVSKCDLWDPFAARGFGKKAALNDSPVTGPGDSWSVWANFTTPAKACGGAFRKDTVIQKAKFESATVGDTTADGWTGDGLWHVSARRHAGAKGTKSFYYGQEITGDYDTGGRTNGFLTSPVYNFSAADQPMMEFQLFLDTEEFFPFDTLWMQVSTDGGATWSVQRSILFWNTGASFRKVSIDLSPLALQSNARVRFYFESLDGLVNFFEGAYIDTVKVFETTQK